MKVLFAGSTFPRWPDDDLPDFVWQQVRWIGQVRPDVRPYVLAPHDAGAKRLEIREGVEIRRVRYAFPERLQRLVYPAIWPNIRRAPWLVLQVPLLLAAEFLGALRWIRAERFDFVYSHWFMPQGVACGLAALVTGTPHVYTSHSADVQVLRRVPGLGPWLVRFLTRRARAVTTVSERSRAALAAFFPPREWERLAPRVAVIPMGIELPPDTSGGPEPDPNQVLFLGRLAEKKGVDYLLRALASEPLRSTRATLTVAGDGPLRGELQALASALGILDRVVFAGFVTGEAKAAAMRGAGVVVLPSIVTDAGDAEGMPVALLEALAAGKIVVATDASGAPEIARDGVEALLVPQRDVAALSAALARALALGPAQRSAMAASARTLGRRFEWSAIARRHASHLFGSA